ncbi:lipopolysaccharide biosynthesis protein [Enterobacter soli]|uniref:lipopolysaccharide biosynthesis protein n=1 Tax=Enterobacter soli TaxID=885040 RepID=UPI003EDA382A
MFLKIKVPTYIFDLSLRIAALGGKFLLMMAIARFLTVKDVGDYGLYVSIIVISLYFVGLDFYVFSTREILDPKVKKNTGEILFNQVVFFLFSYLLLAAVWPGLLTLSAISGVGGLLFALTIAEHLSQECYRILIIKEKITLANFILFVRSGIWCYLCVPLLYFKLIKLEQIFYLWLIFSAMSVFIGVIVIAKFESVLISDFKLDIAWLKRGVKTSFLFFIGTLCLRAINYLDKVIAVHFITSPKLGVYVFFFGVSAAVQAVIDVLVVTRYYPSLVKAIQENNVEETRKAFITFKKKILFYNFGLFLLSIPACYLMIKFTGKFEYVDNFLWYILIVIATSLLNISMPYHYALYSKKKDTSIIFINATALLFFVIITFIGVNILTGSGMLPVLIGLIFSNLFMLIAKYSIFVKEFNGEGRHLN